MTVEVTEAVAAVLVVNVVGLNAVADLSCT